MRKNAASFAKKYGHPGVKALHSTLRSVTQDLWWKITCDSEILYLSIRGKETEKNPGKFGNKYVNAKSAQDFFYCVLKFFAYNA